MVAPVVNSPVIARVIKFDCGQQMLTDACRTLSSLYVYENMQPFWEYDDSLCQRLVLLLRFHANPELQVAALKSICGISRDPKKIEILMNCHLLPNLLYLLNGTAKKL